MASSSTSDPIQETDIKVLKETLRSQQQLLQKLYAEIDVEREASATATNEALSMILRLQGEKAAMKMEASQYKRMTEEKICHAEESLAIFEDLMYQKEMEISSLEFQIQAYKYKILSLGCEDFDEFDKQSPEVPTPERNDALFLGEKGVQATVKRLSSLPSTLPLDFYQRKVSTIDGERNVNSSTEAGNVEQIVHDKGLGSRRNSLNSSGDFNSYWEQIRILDEKVKEISDCVEVGQSKPSIAKVESVCRTTNSLSPSRLKFPPKLPKIKTNESSSGREAIPSSGCSPSTVHDIFEVPDVVEVPETSKSSQPWFNVEKIRGKSILEEDCRLKKPDAFPEETFDSPVEDEIEWIKKNNKFLSAKPEKFCNSDSKSPEYYKLVSGKNEKKLCKLWDQTNGECKSGVPHPGTGKNQYRMELQQLTERVEQLESGRSSTSHEISEAREEELNILRELREQLNSIQSEMKSLRPKKSSPLDELNLNPLTEAMLYFWM
ncbi:hypothetical protein CCACVL1_09269 [Corchorus capsularis]|uniref:GTD-binding domain-containing protein n=1 Tax=Corchorus capsularis TaxID=210143 RepID=A0A1R3IX01_COCAP|nr:hypothetical protein CCACVL1_09269 [Corchorus capsularis]